MPHCCSIVGKMVRLEKGFVEKQSDILGKSYKPTRSYKPIPQLSKIRNFHNNVVDYISWILSVNIYFVSNLQKYKCNAKIGDVL